MPLNPVLFAASCSALAVHHSQKLELLLQHLLHQQFLGAERAGCGRGAVISRKGCSVWEWGRLVAKAEGWDAELVSFGVSPWRGPAPSASTCLWKRCEELLLAPV